MYCPKCGNEYKTGDPFCSKCGTRLTEEKASDIGNIGTEKYAFDGGVQKADLKLTVLYSLMALLFVAVPIIWFAVPVEYTHSLFGLKMVFNVPSFLGIEEDGVYVMLLLILPIFLVCFIFSLVMFKNMLKYRKLVLFKMCTLIGIAASIALCVDAADWWENGISSLVLTIVLCFANLVVEFCISHTAKQLNHVPTSQESLSAQ